MNDPCCSIRYYEKTLDRDDGMRMRGKRREAMQKAHRRTESSAPDCLVQTCESAIMRVSLCVIMSGFHSGSGRKTADQGAERRLASGQ